jgi:hypothetical protein
MHWTNRFPFIKSTFLPLPLCSELRPPCTLCSRYLGPLNSKVTLKEEIDQVLLETVEDVSKLLKHRCVARGRCEALSPAFQERNTGSDLRCGN